MCSSATHSLSKRCRAQSPVFSLYGIVCGTQRARLATYMFACRQAPRTLSRSCVQPPSTCQRSAAVRVVGTDGGCHLACECAALYWTEEYLVGRSKRSPSHDPPPLCLGQEASSSPPCLHREHSLSSVASSASKLRLGTMVPVVEGRTLPSLPVLLAASFALYRLTLVLYRYFLHPLARFPGPRAAAVTSLYEAYHEIVLNGQYSKKISDLHDRYGMSFSKGRLSISS